MEPAVFVIVQPAQTNANATAEQPSDTYLQGQEPTKRKRNERTTSSPYEHQSE